MASILRSFTKKFSSRKTRRLHCNMQLSDPSHVHTKTCYLEVPPLSIVEVFQSQGCKSCVPAVPIIHKAANDPTLLLLTYNVTYWDNLDWKDTLGKSEWDQRHRAYIVKWGRKSAFTPQVIVDGIVDGVGARPGEVASIVAGARNMASKAGWSINIDRNEDTLAIKSDRAEAETCDVLVVSYDPQPQVVKITNGLNQGKELPHKNAVKTIEKIGEWKGGEARVQLPGIMQDGLERVVLVQGMNGGAIVGRLRV